MSLMIGVSPCAHGYCDVPLGGGPSGPDLSTFKINLVEAWDWQNSYVGDYAATPSTQQPGPPPFVDSKNGKGIFCQSTGGTWEVRVNDPSDNVFNPGLKDVSIALWAKYRVISGFGNSQYMFKHKGNAGASPGIGIYYRADAERMNFEFANGTTRLTLSQANGNPMDTTNGNFIVMTIDRDGLMEGFVDKVSIGTLDVSSFELDDIIPTERLAWGNGNHEMDNCFFWDRLLTPSEIDELADSNVAFSDLP
ncbi:MAG: hypothetical protein GY938_12990 [Ketobacter sp.]|nr:hypothetical protein [Ketobacter sp.]